MAAFSGLGAALNPTTDPTVNFLESDVRIKPEIMSPGVTVSAFSDLAYTGGTVDNCAVVRAPPRHAVSFHNG